MPSIYDEIERRRVQTTEYFAWLMAILILVAGIGFVISTFIISGDADVSATERPGGSVSTDAAIGETGFDISDSAIERLIDRIATERAARLVAEDRADAAEAQLQVVREENERLRLLQFGQ